MEGGVVAIGIEKDGAVTGCSSLSEEKIQALEYMGRDSCGDGRFVTRRIEVTNAKGIANFIILARIFYVEERLVELTNSSAYCRESDKSRRLTDVEKQEIRINKGERAFELEPCKLQYPDDFKINEISKFARKIKDTRDGSKEICVREGRDASND